MRIGSNSEMNGKRLKDVKIPERTGLIVLAIKRVRTDQLAFNPKSDEILNEGDVMIVLGKGEQVDRLKKLACVE